MLLHVRGGGFETWSLVFLGGFLFFTRPCPDHPLLWDLSMWNSAWGANCCFNFLFIKKKNLSREAQTHGEDETNSTCNTRVVLWVDFLFKFKTKKRRRKKLHVWEGLTSPVLSWLPCRSAVGRWQTVAGEHPFTQHTCPHTHMCHCYQSSHLVCCCLTFVSIFTGLNLTAGINWLLV